MSVKIDFLDAYIGESAVEYLVCFTLISDLSLEKRNALNMMPANKCAPDA